jgi:hypothetical protein
MGQPCYDEHFKKWGRSYQTLINAVWLHYHPAAPDIQPSDRLIYISTVVLSLEKPSSKTAKILF